MSNKKDFPVLVINHSVAEKPDRFACYSSLITHHSSLFINA